MRSAASRTSSRTPCPTTATVPMLLFRLRSVNSPQPDYNTSCTTSPTHPTPSTPLTPPDRRRAYLLHVQTVRWPCCPPLRCPRAVRVARREGRGDDPERAPSDGGALRNRRGLPRGRAQSQPTVSQTSKHAPLGVASHVKSPSPPLTKRPSQRRAPILQTHTYHITRRHPSPHQTPLTNTPSPTPPRPSQPDGDGAGVHSQRRNAGVGHR